MTDQEFLYVNLQTNTYTIKDLNAFIIIKSNIFIYVALRKKPSCRCTLSNESQTLYHLQKFSRKKKHR